LVFVNILPLDLDQDGLRGNFQGAGQVSNIYIHPRRSWRNNSRFSFVQFWKRDNAFNIFMLNNANIRGMKLFVCIARPKRSKAHRVSIGFQGGRPLPRKVWRKKKQH